MVHPGAIHIVHLTRDYPPPVMGGISTAVAGLVEGQWSAGVEACVISVERRRSVAAADSRICRVGSDGLDTWPADWNPELLHLHDGGLWPMAERLLQHQSLPIVYTVHVDHSHMAQLRAASTPTPSTIGHETALDHADALILPSRSAATVLCRARPTVRDRLHVVRHGIEVPPQRTPSPAEHPEILYVGRFDERKGTADLFMAAPTFLAAAPNARLVVVGGLPANGKAERRWRRHWAERWPPELQRRVEFRGWLEGSDLLAAYDRATVLVVPSRYETFGLTALEGMARGVPIVAAASGGLLDLLEDRKTALLFAPGDVAGLSRAVEEMIGQPLLANRLAAAARQLAATDYAWGRRVIETIDVYDTVRD